MTEKPPVWKNGILWVWSDYYKAYIANYAPSHYLQIGMKGVDDDRKTI